MEWINRMLRRPPRAELEARNAELESGICERDAALDERDAALAERDAEIARLRTRLATSTDGRRTGYADRWHRPRRSWLSCYGVRVQTMSRDAWTLWSWKRAC